MPSPILPLKLEPGHQIVDGKLQEPEGGILFSADTGEGWREDAGLNPYAMLSGEDPQLSDAISLSKESGIEWKGYPTWMDTDSHINSYNAYVAKEKSGKINDYDKSVMKMILSKRGRNWWPRNLDRGNLQPNEYKGDVLREVGSHVKDMAKMGLQGGAAALLGGGIPGAVAAPIMGALAEEKSRPKIEDQSGNQYMNDLTPSEQAGRHPSYWSNEQLERYSQAGGQDDAVYEEIERRQRLGAMLAPQPESIYDKIEQSKTRSAEVMGVRDAYIRPGETPPAP
jgi:hypothetical protein